LKIALIFSLLLFLQGCLVPSGGSYNRVEHDEGKYLGENCSGTVGAPSLMYFPLHGIYLSLKMRELNKEVLFGIHIPEGKSAQFSDVEALKWYQFKSSMNSDFKKHQKGFIKIPNLQIDNVVYAVPLLEFKQDTYYQIEPFNC
jgi:hypothetical protein